MVVPLETSPDFSIFHPPCHRHSPMLTYPPLGKAGKLIGTLRDAYRINCSMLNIQLMGAQCRPMKETSKQPMQKNDPEMTAEDVIEIVQLLKQNRIDVCIDGG